MFFTILKNMIMQGRIYFINRYYTGHKWVYDQGEYDDWLIKVLLLLFEYSENYYSKRVNHPSLISYLLIYIIITK